MYSARDEYYGNIIIESCHFRLLVLWFDLFLQNFTRKMENLGTQQIASLRTTVLEAVSLLYQTNLTDDFLLKNKKSCVNAFVILWQKKRTIIKPLLFQNGQQRCLRGFLTNNGTVGKFFGAVKQSITLTKKLGHLAFLSYFFNFFFIF